MGIYDYANKVTDTIHKTLFKQEKIYPGNPYPDGIEAAPLYNTARNCKLEKKVSEVLRQLNSLQQTCRPNVKKALNDFMEECDRNLKKAQLVIAYMSNVYEKSLKQWSETKSLRVPRLTSSIYHEEPGLEFEVRKLSAIVLDVRLSISLGNGKLLLALLSEDVTQENAGAVALVKSLPGLFEEEINVFLVDSEYLSKSFDVMAPRNYEADDSRERRISYSLYFPIMLLDYFLDPRPEYLSILICALSGALLVLNLIWPNSIFEGQGLLYYMETQSHLEHFANSELFACMRRLRDIGFDSHDGTESTPSR